MLRVQRLSAGREEVKLSALGQLVKLWWGAAVLRSSSEHTGHEMGIAAVCVCVWTARAQFLCSILANTSIPQSQHGRRSLCWGSIMEGPGGKGVAVTLLSLVGRMGERSAQGSTALCVSDNRTYRFLAEDEQDCVA